ncbi:MAG: phosphoglucosamine mutase [Nitrospirae bacterium]|nr:phosphoglucosamine mutase [Nitrospirota bacterium]MBF0615835.1 phosphoglucosamine mutase [Nitrospirota bacterium]
MKLFGTDGIRGAVNTHPMTPETVVRVGMAIGQILHRNNGKNMILIGKDTRLSGYTIESALTSGICAMGMNVTLVGPLPTPGVAYLTKSLRFDAGIVISASHNPFEDNGIKIFDRDGFKLSDTIEQTIESLVINTKNGLTLPHAGKIGKAYRLEDATARYIEYVKSTISRDVDFEGLKVVVDSANGAAYKVTPLLLAELGAEVISLNDDPDGKNINDHCGSLYLENLSKAVISHRAHVGIAHDGDADRTLMCDEFGNTIDGDLIMAIWAKELQAQGKLRNSTVVSTVMSNLGLEHYLNREGITLLRTKVGDRYVVEKMLEGNFNFGGEQSGHIISLAHSTTGDGPITAIQILDIAWKSKKPLSELVSEVTLYPQVLKNVRVARMQDFRSFPEIVSAIAVAESELNGTGRILVRPSGTEPKIRIMVEGQNKALVDDIAERVSGMVERLMA